MPQPAAVSLREDTDVNRPCDIRWLRFIFSLDHAGLAVVATAAVAGVLAGCGPAGAPGAEGWAPACAKRDGCRAAPSAEPGRKPKTPAAQPAGLASPQHPTVRVATFNIQTIGEPGSAQHAAAVAIVRRVDADLLCLQEVRPWERGALDALARSAGYRHVFQGRISTPMAGALTNACLSRRRVVWARSRSSDDISSDRSANETGRDIVAVRVEVGTGRYLLVIAVHLKSGFDDSDRLRRQVETLRVRDLVRQHRQRYPSDALVVVGDFNETVDGRRLGWTFWRAPYGLPRSFSLGRDLRYPIRYDPFPTLRAERLIRAHPTHEDLPKTDGTRIPSGRRIDFVYYSGATLAGSEVYEACHDDGIDAPPVGHCLTKRGSPLPCGTSLRASDHRPVVVDLRL